MALLHAKERRSSIYGEMNDDFPTPPWGTKAFFEYVAPELVVNARHLRVVEPACGVGHMVKVLREYKFKVNASDKFDYGAGFLKRDYLTDKFPSHDLVVTNPPYKLATEFVRRAIDEAHCGVAVLVRTLWLTGRGRYESLFSVRPPTKIAIFSRNMSATRGKLIRKGSNMMSHSWVYWDKTTKKRHPLIWIPPDAQKTLERDEDYT